MVKRLSYLEIKAKDKMINGQNNNYIVVMDSNTCLGHGIRFLIIIK